ncbi:hypothetical protein C8R44DRAFT_989583 [Mycena epipterygia]|nr:hypothetical protein C8R44DRAFT_989583 [Mycena epipterygia]
MVLNLNTITAVILLGLTFAFVREASAQTVTLYALSEGVPSETIVQDATVSYSVAGTNSNGGTTYVEVVAETSLVDIGPSATFTLFSVPTTYTETLVEDASGFAGSVIVFGPGTRSEIVAETCGFGADGHGACIETDAFCTRSERERGNIDGIGERGSGSDSYRRGAEPLKFNVTDADADLFDVAEQCKGSMEARVYGLERTGALFHALWAD